MTATSLIERARRVRMLACDVDGVLTDGKIYYTDEGRELKAYSALDGLGIKMLERSGIAVAWITASRAPAVTARAAYLGVRHVILNAENKLTPWERLRGELALDAEQCAYIGDDLPDVPVLQRCGLAATVPNAPEHVKRHAHYVTRLDGGAGAVRELCEMILAAQGTLAARMAEYGA